MATSGSHRLWVTDWNYLEFQWSVSSQSVADNTSTVAWKLIWVATDDNGAISSSVNKACSVGVNGVWTNSWVNVALSGGQTKTLSSGSTVIKHNADGTKTFSYTYDIVLDIYFSGVNLGEKIVSSTGTLPRIVQASTLTVKNGTLGTAQTLTINRANSSLAHKIRYTCGSASGYAAGSASATITGTSVSWTPPLSLASQNTTGTSVTITLTLETYADGTHVGTSTAKITCSIPASVKPTATFKLTDVNGVDTVYGSPVQGLSRIKITVTGTPAYGSAITAYKISADGVQYNTAEATTAALKTAGDSPVTATVTDGRGRTGSVSYTMKVQAYERPNVSDLIVRRCDADGTENDQGEYIRVIFSAAITNIGGSGKNAAKYTIRYKKTTAADYTEVVLSDLSGQYSAANYSKVFAADGGSSYDVEVVAQDSHASSTRSTSASTAFTLMNWGADGTSLAVGKVAERAGTMEVALDMYTTGSREQTGNRFCLSTPGEASVDGYVLMARITITAANADTPITFVFSRRAAQSPMTVHVRLKNSTATASELTSIRYEGTNYGAFLVKVGEMIWDLYVLKGSEWDTITLQDWWTSKTMESRVAITFPGTLVDTLPGDYYRATPAMLDSLRDYIYPVGSVYISYSHVSPATLFGGTWVRIENAFLWGTTSGGIIGQTGGEQTHTLTENELPAHSHGSVYSQHIDSGNKNVGWYLATGTAIGYGPVTTGGGAAHNNMPPYVQVSIWRRTA